MKRFQHFETVAINRFETLIGDFWAAASNKGLVRLEREVAKQSFVHRLERSGMKTVEKLTTVIRAVHKQLNEYLNGERRSFNIPLDLRFRGFELMVLRAVMAIPFGETRSYKAVAAMIGRPNAYRAAGNAVAKNPITIIIPCHRVVRSDGRLGRYGGDTRVKAWLLKHEGVEIDIT
ncbi:MAG: methylated-DNA--[protein]-cysteine S-methyltransferase [Candidatus Caldarchaeum sp.]